MKQRVFLRVIVVVVADKGLKSKVTVVCVAVMFLVLALILARVGAGFDL